eukprot:CAMPEP_0197928588 /NCGR_PEP_ID=MMETSP1439-20131203/102623_1 /TAXON_ID=66791 /ORGANISM="Gonyaulax spinifera, Strain CCMP409" /LENGTH=253 /DNA_ID=CAMNT_0043551199 /DNA_START=38 /DNA_END=795 /DNA_ORIENTATION=-
MWQAEEDGRRALLKDEVGAAATASGALQAYAAEFSRLRTVAVTRLKALREGDRSPASDGVKAVERALEEMESNRRQVRVQLRLELSNAAGSAKQEWDQRLQEWSREVAALRGQLEEFSEVHSRQALQLPGGRGDGAACPDRHRAMQGTEMLERSSAKLEEARRLALESEEVGQGVLSNLAVQRETIMHMRENMRTIDAELSAARQALNRLIAAAQRNRLIVLVISAVLAVGLAFWALCVLKLPLKTNLALAVG